MQGQAQGNGGQEFPLFQVIDRVRRSEAVILAGVEERRACIAAETGLGGLALAEKLARELTDNAALKSALIAGTAALPFTIPFLGFIPSLILTLTLGGLLQVANEVELVLSIAAAYRTRLEPDRLRTVAFWLVKLSNFDELQEHALGMGVRLTVRKLIEKLVAIGIVRAAGATAVGLMGGAMLQSAAAPKNPWYIRATSFIGVPAFAYLGWRSTQGAGHRAIAYFSDEHAPPPARTDRSQETGGKFDPPL